MVASVQRNRAPGPFAQVVPSPASSRAFARLTPARCVSHAHDATVVPKNLDCPLNGTAETVSKFVTTPLAAAIAWTSSVKQNSDVLGF